MLTDVITSLGTSATYTVTRTVEGDYTNGIYAPGADAEFDIVAAIQPVTGADLVSPAEGEYQAETRKLWTTTELLTRNKTHEPDYIRIGTEWWEVVNVETWTGFGDTHYVVTIVWDSTDNAIDGAGAMQNSNEQSFQYTTLAVADTYVITIPASMKDTTYVVSVVISTLPSGGLPQIIVSNTGRTADAFTLDLSGNVPIGTVFDLIVRDRG